MKTNKRQLPPGIRPMFQIRYAGSFELAHRVARSFFIALLLAGTGCSTFSSRSTAEPDADQSAAAALPLHTETQSLLLQTNPAFVVPEFEIPESPLDYFEWISQLETAAAHLEKFALETQVNELDAEDDCSLYCTKLALLLSASPIKDAQGNERTLALLERAIAAAPEDETQVRYQGFARIWQQYLRTLEQVESLVNERNAQAETIESLQGQIEELTALEKQLIEREEESQQP